MTNKRTTALRVEMTKFRFRIGQKAYVGALGWGIPVEFALAHRRSEDTGYGISDGEY
jgi:hypothetical protein